MNPWAASGVGGAGDGATHAAPYRVALGGLKGFVTRNRLEEAPNLFVDASSFSSTELMRQIERLSTLKANTLDRVRKLEQLEAQVATAGVLLPRQLQAKKKAVASLRGDLEELLAMKSVILRTLQKNVATEYLDVQMQHQRTLIDLFLKLSDELPRFAASAIGSSASSSSSFTTATMVQDVRQRHKEYETAMQQCKATIAKFHLIRDDMARVRAAYSELERVTTAHDATSVASPP